MLVYDEPLSDSDPDPQLVLLGYLQQQDRERYDLYVATATICQSMQKTCKFMMLCQEEVKFFYEAFCPCCLLSIDDFKNEPQHNRIRTNKMTCTSSKDSDQPGHPPSLIRVFAVCMKKPLVLSCPLSAKQRF